MQVYAIYAPAHHTPDKVQATAAVAEADKDDEPAAWSVQPNTRPINTDDPIHLQEWERVRVHTPRPIYTLGSMAPHPT